jgi:ATP-dependent protease ClpP protease subunit
MGSQMTNKENTSGKSESRKTPLYQAIHGERYHRQELIRDIQGRTKRRLICFIVGDSTMISRQDTLGMVELLHFVEKGSDIDLFIHSGGGDVDAADKLINLVRSKLGNGTLRAIVPDMAKSAATLMAIGADRILMSDSSELGPIDPQITLADGKGNLIRHSVQSYLDAHQECVDILKANPQDVAAVVKLQKLDPATVKMFESVRSRARKCAEDLLKQGMLKEAAPDSIPYSKVAADLIDTSKWLSHGQMINYQDAQNMGLIAEYAEPTSREWSDFWQLYCLQRLAVKPNEKLYESDFVSILIPG